MNMNEDAKDNLFDESVAEFKKSVDLVSKKFKLLEKKVLEMEQFAEEFKQSTMTLEKLYL